MKVIKCLLAVSLVILLGNATPNKQITVDEGLSRYVEEFLIEAEKRKVVLPLLPQFKGIIWATITQHILFGNVLGYCDIWEGWVYLNPDFKKQPIADIRQLVFHELLHCLGNLPHDEDGLMKPGFERLDLRDWQKELDSEFSRIGKDSLKREMGLE